VTTLHEKVLASRSYGELRKRLSGFACQRCKLHTGRTQLVVDRGSPSARILLVGEGPGAQEDVEGAAFVGRSGKLLDILLAEAGIDPAKEVLFANVVKCRPPENRKPAREEASACRPYLERQIDLIRPRVMGLLGATAAEQFLGKSGSTKLSDQVGRPISLASRPGLRVVPLYHPAFILRNPRLRGLMVEHLRQLRAAV